MSDTDRLAREALVCVTGAPDSPASAYLKDELDGATQNTITEIEQYFNRPLPLHDTGPDPDTNSDQAVIAVELAEALPVKEAITTDTIGTAQLVKWAHQKLAQTAPTKPTISLGTAEHLALLDLTQRGPTSLKLHKSGPQNQTRINEAFTVNDFFSVVLADTADLHHYQISVHGETTYIGAVQPGQPPPQPVSPDPLPPPPPDTAPEPELAPEPVPVHTLTAVAPPPVLDPLSVTDPLPAPAAAPPAAPPPPPGTSVAAPPPPAIPPPPAETIEVPNPAPDPHQRGDIRTEIVFGERPPDTLARWIVTALICVLTITCWAALSFIEWGIAQAITTAATEPAETPDKAIWAVWGGALVVWIATTIGIIAGAVGTYRNLETRWARSMPT